MAEEPKAELEDPTKRDPIHVHQRRGRVSNRDTAFGALQEESRPFNTCQSHPHPSPSMEDKRTAASPPPEKKAIAPHLPRPHQLSLPGAPSQSAPAQRSIRPLLSAVCMHTTCLHDFPVRQQSAVRDKQPAASSFHPREFAFSFLFLLAQRLSLKAVAARAQQWVL